jgi:hypothetical protein
MRRTSDECPRCGAPLPSAVAGVRLRSCAYCHTTVDEPEPPIPRPLTARAASSNPSGLVGALLVAGCVVLVAVVIAGHLVGRSPPRALASTVASAITAVPVADTRASAAACEPLRALSGLVLVQEPGDADALLLVVEALLSANAQRRLSARDPSNGRELWSRPIAFDGPVEHILRIPFAETLVVALPNRVWGLEPDTGHASWERMTTSAPERACARGREFGLIDAALGYSAYSALTGSPSSLARAACEPTYDSQADAPNFAFVDAATAARWLPQGDGFLVTRGLSPRHGAAQVVLGTQRNEAGGDSASVGVLAGKRWLWQANVANETPNAARFTIPPLAAVREQRVVVPYSFGQRVALTALELTTGERLWTTRLPNSSGRPSASVPESGRTELAIARGGHAAYRTASGELTVLNVDTGAIEWTLACNE